jgi:hypothetical protein
MKAMYELAKADIEKARLESEMEYHSEDEESPTSPFEDSQHRSTPTNDAGGVQGSNPTVLSEDGPASPGTVRSPCSSRRSSSSVSEMSFVGSLRSDEQASPFVTPKFPGQ